MSRLRNTPRQSQPHWSRSIRQREQDAAILASVGLQSGKEENGFFRLQALVRGGEDDSSSTGKPTGGAYEMV